jgi:hypothetical protein
VAGPSGANCRHVRGQPPELRRSSRSVGVGFALDPEIRAAGAGDPRGAGHLRRALPPRSGAGRVLLLGLGAAAGYRLLQQTADDRLADDPGRGPRQRLDVRAEVPPRRAGHGRSGLRVPPGPGPVRRASRVLGGGDPARDARQRGVEHLLHHRCAAVPLLECQPVVRLALAGGTDGAFAPVGDRPRGRPRTGLPHQTNPAGLPGPAAALPGGHAPRRPAAGSSAVPGGIRDLRRFLAIPPSPRCSGTGGTTGSLSGTRPTSFPTRPSAGCEAPSSWASSSEARRPWEAESPSCS